MRVKLELDQSAYAALQASLADRELRAKNVAPALHAIADDFADVERARFAAGDSRWQPLSAEWAARKAHGGRSIIPLAGGNLENSLTRKGARFAVRRVDQRSIVIGTSDPVANLHNLGTGPRTQPTKNGRKRYVGRLPKRRPIIVTKVDRDRWVQLLRKHLLGGDELPKVGL